MCTLFHTRLYHIKLCRHVDFWQEKIINIHLLHTAFFNGIFTAFIIRCRHEDVQHKLIFCLFPLLTQRDTQPLEAFLAFFLSILISTNFFLSTSYMYLKLCVHALKQLVACTDFLTDSRYFNFSDKKNIFPTFMYTKPWVRKGIYWHLILA